LRHTWTLTKVRIKLAMRNRMFLFFSLVMPLTFLFIFTLFVGKGRSAWIGYALGAVLTLTVMGSFWGLSVQLVTFREQGILRRFRLAPLGPGPLLASSILANYFMALPTVAIEVLICRVVLHMPNWGNPLAIFLLVTLGSVTFSSFGLVVASVTNTMQETQIINQLIWMGFLFLSGATVPLASLPHWVQHVTLFSPATYLANGLEAATTGLITWEQLGEAALALGVGFFLAFQISKQLFRWEPEAKAPRRAKLWAAAALVPFLVFGIWENVWGTMLNRVQHQYQTISSISNAVRSESPDSH
jgi:ABC-type transport system involved in cytochrome c biogenesis permease component